MSIDYVGYGYALTVTAGGILGYVKAASLPSLLAGVTFGTLAAVGAYQTSQNPDNVRLSLGTSVVLMCFMGYRFFNTGKFMPAGLVATMSLLNAIRCGFTAMKQ